MNKNLFRIIFNKRRGLLIAVAEASSSQGKGSRGEADTSNDPAKTDYAMVAIGALSFAVLCALGAVLWALPMPYANAQVVAYRQAPGNQQPTVLQTANGVPQVNIQTPSAAGVSHNVYSQFDVQSNGVILNNSRTNVQTKQGGWVQGNPWLATGSARVILNEVNSSNPSYLNGYVEVAGQRAEVVIANPAGISVNGGGFINTSKATLTTGTPIVNGGSLEGYRVQGGNININGNGLDLSTTDYSAILARAVQVNAGIWANELKVVTGANQIDAASLAANTTPVTTTIAGTGAVPNFALDVAQIGGMYAGKIHLIGTEQGLGVRSAGTIGSTGGDLVLQNNGWLTTTGTLQASANLQITTQGNVTNSGTLYASNDQTLIATGSASNSGLIAAQGNTSITANTLSSSAASVLGAGIKTNGTLATSGNLNIATTLALAANGQNLAAGNITLTGHRVDLSVSQTGAANIAITANADKVNTANATVATSGTAGVLAITAKNNNDQTLDNTHGALSAGQLNLDVANLINTQGQITQTGVGDTSIVLTSPSSIFNNTGGTLTVNSANLQVAANTLTNTDGKIQHAGAGALSITADTLSNVRGQVASNNNVALAIGTQVNNTDGVISAAKDLKASAGFALAQPNVSTELNNTRGLIQATAGNLNLNVGNLDNTQGSVYAHADLSLVSTGAINNTGFIAAQGSATLSADSLSSSSSSVLGAGIKADGTLANSGDLKITTTQWINANGQNLAAGNTTLSGSSVNVSGSQTGGANIGITATSGEVSTANATVATAGTLSITAKANNNQVLNNTQGVLSAGQLNVDVANFNNTHGQAIQTGAGNTSIVLTSSTGTMNNTHGTIATNSANLNLSADTLINTDGKIQHAGTGTLHVTASTLNDQRGQIVSNNALIIDAGAVDHRSAGTAAKNITLNAISLNNTEGEIIQTGSGAMAIATSQGLDNTAGALASNGNLTVVAQSLTNNQGQVTALGDLTANLNTTRTTGAPQDAGVLSNVQGLVAAKGNVTITAISVDNTLGTLASVEKNLTTTTAGSTLNDSGKIQAALDITLTNAGLSNTRTTNALATSITPYGSIIGRNVDINTHTQTLNNEGGTIAAIQTANLQTGAVNNHGGLLQTGRDLTINTHGLALTNTNAANYTSSNTALNGKGGIAAQGTSTFETGDLNNDAGYIGSKGSFTATAANISNQAGQIQGLGNLTLTAGNGSAAGNGSGTSTINNTGGLIRSAATSSLYAGTVNNSNTSGTGLGIEGLDVSVSATTLRNDSGAIRADNNITITSAGTVNNNTGLMSAGNTLTLQDLQTQANRTLAITNTNGTLLAGQSLAVAASSIGGDSNILSKGNLNLALNADFVNSGQVIANHNTAINTTGNVSNSSKLQAGNTLSLTANNIDNTVTGEISANTTQVNANSNLTNRGLIDGVDTQINANTVNNIGTGRIYGDHLSIEAVNLTNDTETIAGVTKAGTIAARDRLDLGIRGTLTNREHALIYSVGDIAIGGALDANRRATGLANTVNNNSATIEAGRDLSVNSLYLNNTNEHFSTQIVQVSGPVDLLYIQPAGTTNKILAENFEWQGWSRAGQYRYKTTPPVNDSGVLGASPVPRVGEQNCTGSGVDEVCTRVVGADYPRTDPAWAYFSITPPAIEPAQPNLALPVAPDATGAGACQTGASYNASACSDYNNALTQYNTLKVAYDTAWADYNSAHATWQTETDALYTALDDKIEIYNNGYASAVIRTWTQYAVTRTQSESQVASSDPSQLLSGRNMSLKGTSLINDKSRIVSGGTLDGDLANLNNIQGQGVHVSHEVGTSQYTTTRWRGGLKRYHQRDWSGAVDYAPADEVESISLAVTEVMQNTMPASSNVQLAALSTTKVGATTDAIGRTNIRADAIEKSRVTAVENSDNQIGQATGNKVVGQTSSVQTPQGFQIRSITANTSLPNASLYKTNPDVSQLYLVETDQRFTNNKTWLGSEYMSNALSLDPNVTQKRLGDGFYEQKLIREQVAQLTGRRFLADYTSDEQEYKALMNSAITFAQTYNLRPGIALTAQQVAQLTSDIVWLVEQTVSLPDGTSQKVLVPQVYVKVQPGDLDGSGALLAGKDINLNLSADLTNSGTIAGRKVVSLTAENVNNLGGRIEGEDMQLSALQDLNNVGGSISAVNSLSASARRDLNIQTTTQSGANQVGASSFSRTGVDRVAGLYVSGGNGTLVASAGRDLNIVAGVVGNAGSGTTGLIAGNNLNVQALTTHVQENSVRDANNYFKSGTTQDVGSQINGGGRVALIAGNDINTKAAEVQANQALGVQAGGSVNIEAGLASSNYDEAHKQTNKGFLSSSTVTTRATRNTSTAVGSSLGGDTVAIHAGKDVNIKGSNVVGDNATTLSAGGNVNIEAATNTSQQSSFAQTTKSGFSVSAIGINPIGVSYSKSKQSDDNQNTTTTAAASTVGAINGNVNIQAGNAYKQVGSDVLTPKGDVNIQAKTVDIQEARETSKQSSEQKFEQTSLSVGLKGGIIDSLQAATQAVEAAKDSSSNRNRNLNALIVYAKASDAYEQGKATQSAYDKNGVMGGTNEDGTDKPGAAATSGIKLSVSIGTSKSQSNSTTTSDTAAGSTVKAGGSVNIKATGQGEGDGNLTVQGSKVSAGKDVSLSATKDVNILASADTESNRSSNSSSSTSVGVSVGVDGKGGAGLSLDIAASRGKGRANSDSTTYNNSHVSAGNAVNISSGADTNVVGGNIKATQVTADVGGNLNVESLQDKATSQANQKTTGIAVSIPIVGSAGSASFSQSKQNSNSNYASVNEQSGIQAGDGGFQVNVKGNTDLKGATIASSDKATQEGKNTLTTNTLTTSDINNSMSASASSSGVSVGTNMMDGKYAMAKAIAGNLLNNGSANQSDSSTTTSAISGAQVTVGNKTTDTSKAALTDSNGKTVSTNTSNTNRALAKADVAGLQKSAQDQQASNMLVLQAAVAFTDQAFKASFLDQAKMYKKVPVTDDKGNTTTQWQEMTPEEKAKIEPGSRIANNGIFNGGPNDPKAAQNLADQNSSGGAQYLVHFPQANTLVAELLVAGYQKFLEGGALGLTNATQQNVDLIKQTGGNITLDGHSRGGMTVGNALTAVQEQGGAGGKTNVNLFGSAYNAQDAANTVNQITNGTGEVKQSTNNYDFIGRILGGNAGTGGTIPPGSSALEEVIRTMGGAATVHNCYGAGNDKCSAQSRFGADYVAPPLVPVLPSDVGGKKP